MHVGPCQVQNWPNVWAAHKLNTSIVKLKSSPIMSQGTPLKRSQKTEFNPTMVVQRERSFIKSNNRDQQKRRSQTMATIKANKPTMELYRPPNVRTDLAPGKLNVHAKEFTMSHHELQSSKSSGQLNLQMAFEPPSTVPLQHSKSSGNILRHHHHHHPIIPILPGGIPILHHHQPSQIINLPNYQYFNQPIFSGQNHPSLHHFQQQQQQPSTSPPSHNIHQNSTTQPSFVGQNLKRSKSLGAADSQQTLAAKLRNLAKDEMDLNMFENEEHQMNLKQAIDDPNQLPSRVLMDLVKIILEKAVEGIRYSESIAKLCIGIIEREKNQTFLESLLNMCQQWYQERDKILRGIKAGDGTRFTAFMWFLTEMCSQLKRHQLKDQFESLQPDLVLLSVLAKCCQACITLPIKCLSETECLFFVLTSIGRDLEMELPQQLEQLLASVRDGFLANTTCTSAAVRRTLLQLIELHASNWQLPGSSVLYYYPRIK